MLDLARKPLYSNVYAAIRQEIVDGIYTPGALLPTESELQERFAVSRTTVRKAIAMLRDEKYLEVKQGRGTTVTDFSTTQRLSRISSITETLIQSGHEVTIRGMSIEKKPVPDHLAQLMQMAPGEEIYVLERVLCADGEPVGYCTNHLRAEMVPGLEKYEDKFVGLYSLLEHTYRIVLEEATETLSAAGANFTESQILGIPQGSPLLISKRLTIAHQKPLEYNIARLVGSKYKYSTYLKGR